MRLPWPVAGIPYFDPFSPTPACRQAGLSRREGRDAKRIDLTQSHKDTKKKTALFLFSFV